MSVIVSRALPDARDGLKPVHRRILWSMFDAGHRPDRGHVKCATVVGDVIGKYHPHGDSGHLRRPGPDGSGLLAPPHPDRSPRQLRFARRPAGRLPLHRVPAHRLAMRLLADIDEDTVDFNPNFDGKHQEPDRPPGPVPEPPGQRLPGHRGRDGHQHPAPQPGRGVDAVIHLIDNPDATPDELMEFVKGPDFPTGGPRSSVGSASATPTAPVGARSRCGRSPRSSETKTGGNQIVVTEVPYQTSVEARSPEDGRAGRAGRRHRASGRSATSRPRASCDWSSSSSATPPARRAQQPVQVHADADHLQREHGGPGRRHPPHAEPARGAGGLRRAPARGHPPPSASTGWRRPRPGPTSSRVCSGPST